MLIDLSKYHHVPSTRFVPKLNMSQERFKADISPEERGSGAERDAIRRGISGLGASPMPQIAGAKS